MPSNTLKRKIKQNEMSKTFQVSKKIAVTNPLEGKTEILYEMFVNKHAEVTAVEDKEVIKVFGRHTFAKIDEKTLQCFSSYEQSGKCRYPR